MRIEAGLNVVSEFKLLPEGVHEFAALDPLEIKESEKQPNDIGGRAYNLTFTFTVVGGENDGYKLKVFKSNATKGIRFFLKQLLVSIGVDCGEDGSFDTDQVLGKRFRGLVKYRQYKSNDGKDRQTNELDVESVVRVG